MNYKLGFYLLLPFIIVETVMLAIFIAGGSFVINIGVNDTIDVTCAIYDKGGMCCAPTDQGKFFFKPAINESVVFFGRCKYSLHNGTYLSCQEIKSINVTNLYT